MLSLNDNLLIQDVKELDYRFVRQTNYWRSITVTGNKAQRIVVVSRVKIEGDTISARVEQYYSNPRSRSDSELSLEDERDITFKDKEFAETLQKIREK